MGFMEIALPVVVSFVITVIAGKLLIPALVKLKAGQSIKEIGPTWHMTKQGTPTMGGLMFIIGIGLTIVVLGWKNMMAGSFVHLYVYLFALVFGVIGYIDDYQKVKHHHNTGLTALQKFVLQLAAAVAFLCLMRYEGMLSPNLYIPFWNTHLVLPWTVYLIFAAFVIVGTVNSVNLTDGVDGLAASTTMPVCIFFAVLSILWGERFLSLGVFASGIAGGLLGFLIYNFNPAKVFMGDTGSLFLGGAVAALAECPGPLVVISADTAISLMAVNAKQELVGGVILPGPQLSMNALVQKTAQLPQIDPAARAPESVLGKSTSACLQNGFVLGTASLLDGLADRFCAELGAQTAFYATGDLPRSIREACRTPIHYRETLITDGLHRIWLRNRKG